MDFTPEPYDAAASAAWLICSTCGTQFPSADRSALRTCHICDDPRQFVPPAGQSFTTLAAILAAGHRNELKPYARDSRLVFIRTAPRLGIGQRAVLVRTPVGNVLWDCLTLLDEETIAAVQALGGIGAIVLSHPHFYGAHVQWARAFACPVYVAAEDARWAAVASAHRRVVTGTEEAEILSGSGVRAIKLGGHFPGSMVLLFAGRLLISDTLLTTAAALGNWSVDAAGEARERPAGLNSFAFAWSIPNSIPLSADEMARMWAVLRGYEFRATHGGFEGLDVEDDRVKERVLESMKMQTRAMGFREHALLEEEV